MPHDQPFFPALGNGLADWIMALAALASVGASVWAIILAFRSLKAAQEANATSAQAVADTRETGKKQIRAYMAAMKFDTSAPAIGQPFKLRVDWMNMGQTPARDVEIFATIALRPKGETALLDVPLASGGSKNVVAANDGTSSHLLCPPLGIEDVASINAGTHGFLLASVCRYRDVFGDLHDTTLRLHFLWNGQKWVPEVSGYGNEMN